MQDLTKKECYNGKQIKPLWALEKHGITGDSFVVFRGSMKLTPNEMIDLKDIIREKELAEVLISGDDCLHFIIEMFDDQPANLKIAYHRLHILSFIAQKILESSLKITLEKKGTDLYYDGRKMNVAIATGNVNSTKIHFGINIVSTGVPSYVKAIGIQEIDKNINIEKLVKDIGTAFINELTAIKEDIVKTRTF
ncbi:MAG: DUF366 family protein [Candidatus Thorarchaeota archaeon]